MMNYSIKSDDFTYDYIDYSQLNDCLKKLPPVKQHL